MSTIFDGLQADKTAIEQKFKDVQVFKSGAVWNRLKFYKLFGGYYEI